eukprot:Hpha_TRINITY_DN10080_c0_g1::TRINITY_DN10080_c0_g1_i1::g.84073::m.84073
MAYTPSRAELRRSGSSWGSVGAGSQAASPSAAQGAPALAFAPSCRRGSDSTVATSSTYNRILPPPPGVAYRSRNAPPALLLGGGLDGPMDDGGLRTPHPRTPHGWRRASDSTFITGTTMTGDSRRPSYQAFDFQANPELAPAEPPTRLLRVAPPPPIHINPRPSRSGSIGSEASTPATANLVRSQRTSLTPGVYPFLTSSPRGTTNAPSPSAVRALRGPLALCARTGMVTPRGNSQWGVIGTNRRGSEGPA